MDAQEKENVIIQGIKDLGSNCLLQNLLISTNPIGFLGKVGQIELATDSNGVTHIGVRDVFEILGDEKEFLLRCNNNLLRSVLTIIDKLVNCEKIHFCPSNFKIPHNKLTTIEVGVLENDVQVLYDKYNSGFLSI